MIIKFDVSMYCDPSFNEGEGPEVKGFASFDRSAHFRTLNLTKEQAERLFNQMVTFLENKLEMKDAKSK